MVAPVLLLSKSMIFADLVSLRRFVGATLDRVPPFFWALLWRAVRLFDLFGMMVSFVWSGATKTGLPPPKAHNLRAAIIHWQSV